MKVLLKSFQLLTLLLFSCQLAAAQATPVMESEKAAVKAVIQNAVDAMYNNGDVAQIQQYYHPDYELLLLVEGNQLYKMSLKDRLGHVREALANNQFPAHEQVSIQFEIVDVAYSTATVKFDYFRADRQTCIDIMTLYKFDEGWRIVSQTTHHIRD